MAFTTTETAIFARLQDAKLCVISAGGRTFSRGRHWSSRFCRSQSTGVGQASSLDGGCGAKRFQLPSGSVLSAWNASRFRGRGPDSSAGIVALRLCWTTQLVRSTSAQLITRILQQTRL